MVRPADRLLLGVGSFEENGADDQKFIPINIYDVNRDIISQQDPNSGLMKSGHLRKKTALQWVHDSIYLDLLILDKCVLHYITQHHRLFDYLNELKCPVMILDPDQDDFSEVQLIFNGTDRSFEAIKAFTYLFNECYDEAKLNLLVKVGNEAMEHEMCVYEYLRNHKKHFSVTRLFNEDFKQGVENILDLSMSPLMVCGGERKLNVSQFIQYSLKRTAPLSMFLL